MTRADKRKKDEMRPLRIVRGFIKHAEGSTLIEMGKTMVVCTASIESKIPAWSKDSNTGWATAEYGMLPRCTQIRIPRERAAASGRTFEIQRFIGRSLRAILELSALGERTITIDCDVIQADGGTRALCITGSMVALVDAVEYLRTTGCIEKGIIKDFVAAVSVGIVDGEEMLDLDYREDSMAEVDLNLVMTGKGKIVEVQGTAEREPFSKDQLDRLITLGEQGISRLIEVQKETVRDVLNLVLYPEEEQ